MKTQTRAGKSNCSKAVLNVLGTLSFPDLKNWFVFVFFFFLRKHNAKVIYGLETSWLELVPWLREAIKYTTLRKTCHLGYSEWLIDFRALPNCVTLVNQTTMHFFTGSNISSDHSVTFPCWETHRIFDHKSNRLRAGKGIPALFLHFNWG